LTKSTGCATFSAKATTNRGGTAPRDHAIESLSADGRDGQWDVDMAEAPAAGRNDVAAAEAVLAEHNDPKVKALTASALAAGAAAFGNIIDGLSQLELGQIAHLAATRTRGKKTRLSGRSQPSFRSRPIRHAGRHRSSQ
jgi:hypothetical protein